MEGKPQVALNLNTSGSSVTKQHRQYSIPSGTCFGYSCFKMKIGKDGLLNLQLPEDVVDGPAAESADHEGDSDSN